MGKHFYISAGETSGEQHAANLVAALTEVYPDASFSGMGSEILSASGVELTVDTGGKSVMGFTEVLAHIPKFKRWMNTALDHIGAERPDAVILVDYPGFHLRLAKSIARRWPDVPVIYYIAPKAWAWNEGRVKKMARCIDLLLCIFPFEEEWFGSRGIASEYVGNPTADAVRGVDGSALRKELGIGDGDRLISIFPGSRRKELERILPPMIGTARKLGTAGNRKFAISVAPGFSRKDFDGIVTIPDWICIVESKSRELIAASDLLLAKSGTTTLEAALLNVPMVVVYKASWLSAFIARRVIRIPYISLPNILAEKTVVCELLQENATADGIAAEAERLLECEEYRAGQKKLLSELRDLLGDRPSAMRAAMTIRDFMEAE